MLEIEVPATLSNLGPGFDVLGMAVDLKNRFTFETEGEEKGWIADGQKVRWQSHVTFRTMMAAARKFGGTLPESIELRQVEQIPRSRGLGSSATARAAGFIAWSQLTGVRPSLDETLAFLTEEEKHPDNVVPAMVGGLVACGHDHKRLVHFKLSPPEGIHVALCIPELRVSTERARSVLPSQIPKSVAVFNASRLAFLMIGLLTGREEALNLGTEDKLHQPHRKRLIGPVDAAMHAARKAGAVGSFISGSGSTLAAFARDVETAEEVAQAMANSFKGHDLSARALSVRPISDGAWG